MPIGFGLSHPFPYGGERITYSMGFGPLGARVDVISSPSPSRSPEVLWKLCVEPPHKRQPRVVGFETVWFVPFHSGADACI